MLDLGSGNKVDEGCACKRGPALRSVDEDSYVRTELGLAFTSNKIPFQALAGALLDGSVCTQDSGG